MLVLAIHRNKHSQQPYLAPDYNHSAQYTTSSRAAHCTLTTPLSHSNPTTTPRTVTMSAPNKDDLEPEVTEGFKVGEKKTIDEYQQLGEFNLLSLVSTSRQEQVYGQS